LYSSIEYKISVIIVTHNSQETLKESLTALCKSDNSECYEIIVVDNDSNDKSLDIVHDVFQDAKVIKNNNNLGFAKACNIGAKNALGEYLLFYNPDLMIDKNSISHLLDICEKTDNAGAVTGRMRFPDERFQPTCRKFPTKENIIYSRGSVFSFLNKNKNKYTLPDYDDNTEVDAVAGTFTMIKREIFEKVGMFDERYFMYMEDTDLCLRLNQAGYKNYFVSKAGGVHLWAKGSSTGRFIRSYYQHVSIWKYFLKQYPNSFSLLFLPILLLLNFMVGMIIKRENK
jgi:GT2 family glycosyltransferase